MATTQIGAQMYTLRDHTKTPADLAKTCQRLAADGFGAVQVSAVGPIEADELRKILDDHGLVCAATHQSVEQLSDTQACLDYHAALGCRYTAIGGTRGDTEQDWRDFAKKFNDVCAPLNQAGLRVGYHNHSHELAPLGDPRMGVKTPLDILLETLDPTVWFEIDTYWIAHGGGDPAAWIDRCAGRIPAVHVKDMTITPDREHKMCEVGSGNLNWTAIWQACKRQNVEWYLIERDSGDLDPFESLKISLDQMKQMGLN